MKTNSVRTHPQLTSFSRKASRASVSIDESRPADLAPLALKIKRILVPTDFSNASVEALKYAVPLAHKFGAAIFLMHVVESGSFANDLENVPLAIPEANLTNSAREHLVSLSRNCIHNSVPVVPHIRVGKPFLEIATLASMQDIDLIVIATHGHTGWKHVLLGSTAEKVVRHAPCPVLTVREHEQDCG